MTIPTSALRSTLVAFGCLALMACFSEPVQPNPENPNIVLLIGDDHGYSDFGFMGSEWVQTPNLDRLSEGGITFELAHTTASHCRPSLNTLLTGLLPIQWNDRLNLLKESESGFDENTAVEHVPTLPRLLRERGYVSFQAGKYWEGDFRTGGFSDGMTKTFDPESPSGGEGIKLGREIMEPVYRFIDDNADHPFFLWFAPMLPHLPHDAPEKFRDLYDGKGLSDSASAYFANCTWYDDVVGRLLNFLSERDLLRNTLVIYVSDNGWEQNPFTDRIGPLQGLMGGAKGKLSLHDRGFRTPILVSWPGVIEARRIPDQLVSTADLVPTLLDFAGAPVPAALRGTSLRPIIEGTAVMDRPFIIGSVDTLRRVEPMRFTSFNDFRTQREEMRPAARAFHLRSPNWHYLWYESDHRDELYDVARDPDEERDVATEHPDRVAQFRTEIERWRQTLDRPGAPEAR
jgi:arylsulfatase A-like enzyme